ncbi:MAG: OmpA family protein [Alphaproteobacteria bacterium]|nr:OmpA family protein [Alphaproteobacteria bacterium]
MQLPDITFDTARATLRAEYRSMLEDMAVILSEYPNTTITITGHTDSTGSPQVNQRLSESRARAVADFLQRQAVTPDRFAAVTGVGESQPVASNESPLGRQQNRRVEVRLRQRN